MSIKTLASSAGMLVVLLLPVLAQETPKTLPEDQHKQLFVNVCGSCHEADLVIGDPREPQGWSFTVDRMVEKGASASDEELEQIVNYLVKYFGMPVNMNSADVEEIQTLGLTEDQAKA